MRFPRGDGLRRPEFTLRVATPLLRRRKIELRQILIDHPRCVVTGQDGGNRALRLAYPFRRVAGVAAVVIQRNDVVLENLVECSRFFEIAVRLIERFRRWLDGPAVVVRVTLVPPAIENG